MFKNWRKRSQVEVSEVDLTDVFVERRDPFSSAFHIVLAGESQVACGKQNVLEPSGDFAMKSRDEILESSLHQHDGRHYCSNCFELFKSAV